MIDLVALLDRLDEGAIEVSTAGRLAEEVTAGREMQTSIGRRRVMEPMADVERALAALRVDIAGRQNVEVRKWAGTYLMLRAQLGTGILNSALEMLARMVEGTRGVCPQGAERYVAAMFDATIAAIPDEHTQLILSLREQRALFGV